MPADLRPLFLAGPSLVLLALLVFHSFRTLSRPRASAFWGAVVGYGFCRGAAVRWITEVGLGSPVPYSIHRPLLTIAGVSAQEVAGWAIVAYLAWWFGARLEKNGIRLNLFAQLLWSSFLLGAISWAIETAAIAAGWWHWTVPAGSRLLLGVPFIGLVDWFFVGIDFLVPFVLLTSPALRSPLHILALALFPVHFASHLLVEPFFAAVPAPGVHVVHGALLAFLVYLAFSSDVRDPSFREREPGRRDILPFGVLVLLLVDIAVLEGAVLRRPVLLLSAAPVLVLALVTLRPKWTAGAAGFFAVLAVLEPPAILATSPPIAVAVLRAASGGAVRRRKAIALVLSALAFVGCVVGAVGVARRERLLGERLGVALVAREKGDVREAERLLEEARRDFPSSHVPPILLAEIAERTGRLPRAAALYDEAVLVKGDAVGAYRHLAAIRLALGERASSLKASGRALEVKPLDLELSLLRAEARGDDTSNLVRRAENEGPRAVLVLARLANAIGDRSLSRSLLEGGLYRWPFHRPLYSSRARLALEEKDEPAARRTITVWRERWPNDPEASRLAERLPRLSVSSK